MRKMYIARFTLVGISPLQQSRAHEVEREPGEGHNAHEERTWKFRAHIDEKGKAYHPAGALKQAILCAAGKDACAVPGKGKCQWKGFFESGVCVPKNLQINKTENDIVEIAVFGSSTGDKGGKGGRRVWKKFPTYFDWEARGEAVILDETITQDKFLEMLEYAGVVAGLGTWRPQNGGDNGRFRVKDFSWGVYTG